MKPRMIAGIVLIVIGMLALVYKGLTYTTQKNVIDIGPIKATVNEEKTLPISPIVGALALAGGAVLLLTPYRAR